MSTTFKKNAQYHKFCAYGFLKNLRFFDAFLLLYFLENGITYTQIGILYATREILTHLLEIPSGLVADTYGRKNSLLAALFAYLVSFLVFYVSTQFYVFLFAMVLYGVGDAFRSGTHKGMIMDYLRMNGWEKQKVAYYGHTRSWSMIGSAVSALFAGAMVLFSGSYRTIYLFALLPYLLNLLNIYTYPQSLNHSNKPSTTHRSMRMVFHEFWLSMKNPRVLGIVNSAGLHTAFLKAIKDYIQPVMVQVAILIPILGTFDIKRKNGLIIGIIYFLIFLANSFASRNAAKILDLGWKNLSMKTLMSGLILGGICGLSFWWEQWIWALALFVVIFLIENSRKPILTGELADNVPNEILTSVLSAQSLFTTFMAALIALSFGILADQLGIGISLFAISAFLIAFTLFMKFVGRSRQDSTQVTNR